MMKSESYALFPIRGLWMALDDVSPQLLDRDWALVDPRATDAIDALIPGGMKGNVEMLHERMKPDALLIVRRYLNLENVWEGWREAADYAERVISALNFLFLSAPIFDLVIGTSDGQGIRSSPVPVWLTRVPEHPELPLIFRRNQFFSSGHSQMLNWPNLEELRTSNPRTMSEIDTVLQHAPPIIKSILSGDATASFENATRAFMLSFNATTQGQFIAQSLSSLDILFGENDGIRWAAMSSYVETLCGNNIMPNLVFEIFQMRHRFIHRHLEPSDPCAHFVTLAVVASAFIGWTELSATYGDRTTTLDVLEARGRLMRAAKSGHQSVANALSLLEVSVQPRPQWVIDWLSQNARRPV